jgi:predicted DNA-binding protein
MSGPIEVVISEASRQTLAQLAEQTGKTMAELLDEAVEEYRRKLFLQAVNAGYAAMRADPQLWAEELAERTEWDPTLLDGLDSEERWSEDGRCLTPDQEGK